MSTLTPDELHTLHAQWLRCAELFLRRGRAQAARDAVKNAARVRKLIRRARA